MRKAVLWGTGNDFSRYLNLIHYFELKGDIRVAGVTAKEEIYDALYGYKFYKKEMLYQVEFDIVIVMSDLAFREIECEIRDMRIQAPVVPGAVLSIPGFDFEKYIRIKENVPTIFACNCWGGLMYHRLRLPFTSPFINLFVEGEDYLRFLCTPKDYMDQTVEWSRMAYDEYLSREYPVGVCGDIEIHFNHYKNFDDAKADWKRRRERIRWDRIFIMMYTEDDSAAARFSQLPYERKICFVPFKSELQGVYTIPWRKRENVSFFEIVNGIASGRYHDYDILSILSGETVKNSEWC